MAGSIVSEPLNPHNGFNWVFLVELLICGILTVFFLFYFNRLFATLVSYGIRAYTWRAYHAYIDIQALQISLLGGRIFFKDIRYHGHNETILIHGGYITWNYWLRRVRDAGVFSEPSASESGDGTPTPSSPGSRHRSQSRTVDRAEKGGRPTTKRQPCRISIKISGVEAFIYNRSPAYDGIIDAIRRKADHATDQNGGSYKHAGNDPSKGSSVRGSTELADEPDHQHNKLQKDSSDKHRGGGKSATDRFAKKSAKKDEPPSFLRILPVHVDCNKGAIVIGNEHTHSVITAQFEKASGEFDASPCGPLDVYQQVFNFQFTRPVVHMRPNPDFKATQLDTAMRLKQEAEENTEGGGLDEKRAESAKRPGRRVHLARISGLFSKSSDSIHTHPNTNTGNSNKVPSAQWSIPGQERWKGLTRYLDESQNDGGHGEWDGVEYAKTSLVMDCPCINVSFYWDIPGPVPSDIENSMHMDPTRLDDINGSVPPEYGVDIQIYGGTINYGPWADRHRGVFQAIFFPGPHVDAIPANVLKPGDGRVLSVFKLYLAIEDDTVLRIPVRESSKDWKWKGKAHTLAGHDKLGAEKGKGKPRARKKTTRTKRRDPTASGQNVRPFAWIDIKVAGDSTINYVMDMVASEAGFKNRLGVDIAKTEIFSSVNHGLLWRSGAIALDCDLSNPVRWNGLRKWLFNISCRDLELFLLRDHLFLLTDLVADWGSGPPPNYFTFVPFQYVLNVDFLDFKLHLNTNDSNIVNNPSDLDDNNFLVLYGQRLHGDVTIPLDRFRSLHNEIKFDVRGQELGLEVCMPPKNTLHSFVRSKNVAHLGGLTLLGSHTYLAETSPMNTDRLFMDIRGDKLYLELYGWLVHHFMKIKDNYFGDDMHFKTLEEFQGLPSVSLSVDITAPNGQPTKLSNDLDVILCISAEHATVLIPANLYSAEKSLRADLPYTSADLRFTNYYMDLMVNFSPISLSLGSSVAAAGLANDASDQTEVFIQSVAIFGHRLFGLPPTEPTYVCNWDFEVGRVSGECTESFIQTAAGAIRAFAFTFDDDENTLQFAEPLVIHDATFLRLRTEEIRVWLEVAKEVILVSSASIRLDFNDLAGSAFSQCLNATIPDLTLGFVDAQSAFRHRTRSGEKKIVETHAFLQTSLSLNMFKRKLGFTEERNKQQVHMQEHDQRTNRTQFMFTEYPVSSGPSNISGKIRPPAVQYPEIPHPIFLFRPGTSARGSLVSSSCSSGAASSRGRALPTASATNRSLASSIRSVYRNKPKSNSASSSRSRTLLDNTPSRVHNSDRHYTRLSEEERSRRNLAPSSVALSSPLATPYFPLDLIEPDLTEVPAFPHVISDFTDEGDVVFNDVSTKHLDETFSHTSLIITAEPGIRLFCSPESVRCMSNLVESLQPRHPEDLLDDFQITVMTSILDYQKRREGKGKSIEFGIRVPYTHIRFQNEFVSQTGGYSGKDQYDVILNQLRLAARIKKFPGERAGENSVSLHTTLGSLGLSVTEKDAHGANDEVAVQAEITDILVWMLKGKEAVVNINLRTFELATASKKIEYLASLVHRTNLLGEELGTRFESIRDNEKCRLRYLAWHLTTVREQFQDPAFLTKASFALRAVRDHLRSHDSWKIISRFRYLWLTLNNAEKSRLKDICAQQILDCPGDAEEKIISLWDRWRAWDLAHVKKSLAMRTIFGTAVEEQQAGFQTPLCLNFRSEAVKLMVDPGPKQSEVSLQILAVTTAILPPPEPSGLMLLGTESPKESIVVEVNSRKTGIHIHWEICELVDILLRMFQGESSQQSKGAPGKACPTSEEEVQPLKSNLHIVYVTDRAEISLDTVNLQSTSIGQRFKVSVVVTNNRASGQSEMTSVHCHLEQGLMHLHSGPRLLFKSQFDLPSLYLARHEHGGHSLIPDEVKVAGTSRMIKVQIEEDILGLIEVADAVLRDEVAYFHEQASLIQKASKAKSSASKADEGITQLPNITLALLMDAYNVDLTLFRSLSWSVTGSSGRISVVPSLGRNVSLRVDYDLEAHTHRLCSDSLSRSNVISSIQLPPVNGRVIVTNAEKEMRVSAAGIIETIDLQASEIQALIATLNRPEVSSAAHAIGEDMEALQAQMKHLFPKASKTPVVETPKPSRDLVFSIQMTLSGLNIRASAPGQYPDSATANLAVRLSSIQLKATNIGPNRTIIALPEGIVHMNKISMEMTLSDAHSTRSCGNLTFGAILQLTAQKDSEQPRRVYRLKSSGLEINIFADTASAVVDVMNHLQDKIKDLDLSKEKKYLRRLRHTKSGTSNRQDQGTKSDANTDNESISSGALFTSAYSLELLDIQVSWVVGSFISPYPGTEPEDLVLSFKRVDLSTRKDNAARLMIEDMRLQMVPVSTNKRVRSSNSALLPEIVFNVGYSSTKESRSIAFHAAGKSLHLQLDSRFILPANVIERSIALAGKKFRTASANWNMTPTTTGAQRKNPFGNKRLASLLVDANFAGAVVHINGRDAAPGQIEKVSRSQQKGRYSQFVGESSKSSMDLRAPGVALKVEYQDQGQEPSLNAELRVDGSNNTLYPTVVPVIIEISESIKQVVRDKDDSPVSASSPDLPSKPGGKLLEEDNLITADPSTILGRTRLNLGLRICKQEFSLSCQPIARVAAIAKLEDIYITMNSVKSQEHGHFFAVSAAFEKLEATVQHVYSRESTFGFNVDSVVLSMMNSKHLSGTSGISAILKINPMGLQINARQLQDFLLFREIWIPPEIRQPSKPSTEAASQEPQEYLMQRYQQVTAATAFPWNANIAIADVAVELDLGQAIGKTSLSIHNMWASSKKGTDWEQNLCIGVEEARIESTGRTSGFVELAGVRVRTSISWPSQDIGIRQTPLVQASIGFRGLRVKAGFDYQAFVIADIANFDFLMYNVREQLKGSQDRLVAILDGDKVHVFCTATSAAQGLALWQAIERLVQENQQAYKQSLKDIEKFLRRKSFVTSPMGRSVSHSMIAPKPVDSVNAPISLHTDVVATLRSINLGVFPSTFVDTQILMLEAADAQARFAVALEHGNIHSALGMTLGQLSVALSPVSSPKKSKPVSDLTVEDVIDSARSGRGGTILRVPKVVANMHTWQAPHSNHIDYLFKSLFEGKVDVGWNYNRISYIRSMWSNHSRTLASRLGKPLPESNIKITSSQQSASSSTSSSASASAQQPAPKGSVTQSSTSSTTGKPREGQEKITAVVNVPQSRYEYTALEPPLIETPQLRDMGEATPPLEWIGLHRDRLPNVTHQIVIQTLLEVAREVEDAYERILGSS